MTTRPVPGPRGWSNRIDVTRFAVDAPGAIHPHHCVARTQVVGWARSRSSEVTARFTPAFLIEMVAIAVSEDTVVIESPPGG